MNATHVSREPAGVAAVAVWLVTIFTGCAFNPPHGINWCLAIDNLPLTPVVGTPPVVGFETPGVATAIHGSGTATLDHGDLLKVEQSVDLPAYANRATVFLNGWRLEYTGNDDQNVLGLGTLIGKIRLEGKPRQGRRLTWNAVGIIQDYDGAEAYSWQYFYTVLAWNDTALNVMVNHDDADNFCKAGTGGSDNFYIVRNTDTETALSSFQSLLQNPQFPPTGVVAVLPRGFGFSWQYDHDLLQVAYNLDHSETSVEHGKKYVKALFSEMVVSLSGGGSRVDSRYVSWNTQSILKDNELRRDYEFGEMVSALGGADVGTVQPPYAILPREDVGYGTCIPAGIGGESHQDIVIENLPFEYAIPMLTGWELAYPCDSHNVKAIGIGIEEWRYDKDPAVPAGTLRYKLSSLLRDKDGDPGYSRSHKVSILGLRPVERPTLGQNQPR